LYLGNVDGAQCPEACAKDKRRTWGIRFGIKIRIKIRIMGDPGTPYLTAGVNSGKSGGARKEEALRLMPIRQARLEPLA